MFLYICERFENLNPNDQTLTTIFINPIWFFI